MKRICCTRMYRTLSYGRDDARRSSEEGKSKHQCNLQVTHPPPSSRARPKRYNRCTFRVVFCCCEDETTSKFKWRMWKCANRKDTVIWLAGWLVLGVSSVIGGFRWILEWIRTWTACLNEPNITRANDMTDEWWWWFNKNHSWCMISYRTSTTAQPSHSFLRFWYWP